MSESTILEALRSRLSEHGIYSCIVTFRSGFKKSHKSLRLNIICGGGGYPTNMLYLDNKSIHIGIYNVHIDAYGPQLKELPTTTEFPIVDPDSIDNVISHFQRLQRAS